MKKQTMQMGEKRAEKHTKRKKYTLVIVASTIVTFILLAMIGTFFWYQAGSISGHWRNTEVEREIVRNAGITSEGLFEGLLPDNMETESIMDIRYALEIKDKQAILVGDIVIKKEMIATTYDKLIENEYQKLLTDITAQAATLHLSPEELLIQTFGTNYEQAIKSNFPDIESVLTMVDEQLQAFATNNGFKYDRQSGKLSTVIFTGEVNQLLHAITITSINHDALTGVTQQDISIGDQLMYHRQNNTLTFFGDNSTFTLEK